MWRDSSRWSSYKYFSYLLWDEGEFYVQGCIVTCVKGSLDNSQHIKPSSGQLQKMWGYALNHFFNLIIGHFQSSSLLRTKVKSVEALKEKSLLPIYNHEKWQGRQEGFVLETSFNVTMKENGLDSPYKIEKQDSAW